MLKEECSRDKWTLEYSDPDDFTICMWQKSPGVRTYWVTYRAFVVLGFFIGMVALFAMQQENFPWYKLFLFNSFWAYTAQFISFTVAFGVSLHRYLQQKKDPETPPLDVMPCHYKLLWILSNITGSITAIVLFIFWLVNYDPAEHTNMFRIMLLHTFNSGAVVLDFALNAFPYRFLHFYIPILFTVVYALFTVAYQLLGGTGVKGEIPIYPILDWRHPPRALFTCGIYLASVLIIHAAFCVLNILKLWVKKTEPE